MTGSDQGFVLCRTTAPIDSIHADPTMGTAPPRALLAERAPSLIELSAPMLAINW
jgi:hypothetical protein